MRELWRGVLDLLLPRACADCGGPVPGEAALCRTCDAGLPRLPAGLCLGCQDSLVPSPEVRCPACRDRPRRRAASLAAISFTGPATAWIHRFKYPSPGLAGLDPAARAVASSLIREAGRRAPGPRPGAIVPVPLHPRRLRQRGFNPALLLARALAREQGIPVRAGALRRIRDTPSQTGLDRHARRLNLAGAFRSGSRRPLPQTVWLVDDVVTTGSTVEEAARMLRRAGARRVVAICVARTPPVPQPD